ncbi:MAG: carboxypeptidase-like regulatory domain-containing protein [Planctomycetota bacterium]
MRTKVIPIAGVLALIGLLIAGLFLVDLDDIDEADLVDALATEESSQENSVRRNPLPSGAEESGLPVLDSEEDEPAGDTWMSGLIRSWQGEAISEASIVVRDQQGHIVASTTSGKLGHYRLARRGGRRIHMALPTALFAAVQAAGFRSHFDHDLAWPHETETAVSKDFFLRATKGMIVRIVDDENDPLPGATLSIAYASIRKVLPATPHEEIKVADADGCLVFHGGGLSLPGGDHAATYLAKKPGYVSRVVLSLRLFDVDDEGRYVVTMKKEKVHPIIVAFVATEDRQLDGPIAFAVLQGRGFRVLDIETNVEGESEFEVTGPGPYRIVLKSERWGIVPESDTRFQLGSRRRSGPVGTRDSLLFSLGKNSTSVFIALEPTKSIVFNVVHADTGRPVPNVAMELLTLAADSPLVNTRKKGTTDVDGRLEIFRTIGPTFVLRVADPNWEFASDAMSDDFSTRSLSFVGDGVGSDLRLLSKEPVWSTIHQGLLIGAKMKGSLKFNLYLRPLGTLICRLLDKSGKEVRNARVQVDPAQNMYYAPLFDTNPRRHSTRVVPSFSDSEGIVRLGSFPTDKPLRLFVEPPQGAAFWTSGMRLSADPSQTPQTIIVPDSRPLEIQVEFLDGRPAQGVGIRLRCHAPTASRPAASFSYGWAVTNDKGLARFPRAPLGRVGLWLLAPDSTKLLHRRSAVEGTFYDISHPSKRRIAVKLK